MTDKKSRRVVIINNINSDTIDQAIFILKSDKRDRISAKADNSIVYEAQNIINNYIRQVERIKLDNRPSSLKKKKSRNSRMSQFLSLTAAIAALAGILAIFFITGTVLN